MIKYLISGSYDIYTINYSKEPGDCISADEVSNALITAEPVDYAGVFK